MSDEVIQVAEVVNLDTTAEGKICGIEILRVSDQLNLETSFASKPPRARQDGDAWDDDGPVSLCLRHRIGLALAA